MGVRNYLTLGDTIIGENVVGGGRVNYATDALGSVTGTLVGGGLENLYAYKPFGSSLQETGPGLDPAFRWVGTKGYRNSKRDSADFYVRARHYSSRVCSWTTRDPLWPEELAYSYCAQRPVSTEDPTGLWFQDECMAMCEWIFKKNRDQQMCKKICKAANRNNCNSLKSACKHASNTHHRSDDVDADMCWDLYGMMCKVGTQPALNPSEEETWKNYSLWVDIGALIIVAGVAATIVIIQPELAPVVISTGLRIAAAVAA